MNRLHTLPADLPILLPTLLAAALLTSPTWGALDYHASLALAPVVGLGAMTLALQPLPLLRRVGWTVALPLLVLLAGSLFVPNCNRVYGLEFYALGPLCSAFVGIGWARLGQLLLPRHAAKLAWTGALLPLPDVTLKPPKFSEPSRPKRPHPTKLSATSSIAF